MSHLSHLDRMDWGVSRNYLHLYIIIVSGSETISVSSTGMQLVDAWLWMWTKKGYHMIFNNSHIQSVLLLAVTTYLVAIQKRLTLRSHDTHKKLLNYSMGIARQFPYLFLLYPSLCILLQSKRLTLGSCDCYKFILMFNGGDCQNMFIPNRCLYVAPDYVIDAQKCGRLDSCHVVSCFCNNVDVNIRAYVIVST